jgi:D-alanyl-D-alanine dipeptidase
VLEPGMSFSVEPGVYIPGRFGIRIEDIVAIVDNGPRRLNESDRRLAVVS